MNVKKIKFFFQEPGTGNQKPKDSETLTIARVFSLIQLTTYKFPPSTFILVLIFLFTLHVKAQDNSSEYSCLSQLKKTFISDGQDHQIIIHNSKYSQLHVIFYPQFTYRVVVCVKNKNVPIEFNLTSEQGAVIFDNTKSNYIKEWDFAFDSMMKGIINVKFISKDIKELPIKIVIGYKIVEKKIN